MKKPKLITAGVCSVLAILGIVQSQAPELRTNREGMELIANAEGCRTKPYNCSAAVLTVGIGSTDKVENRTYTNNEIAQRFIADLQTAEACVNAHANGKNLNQNQFNAITSFVFNVGCRKDSTLFRLAREGKFKAMCQELIKWKYVNGKVSNGIIQRRKLEMEMCLRAEIKEKNSVD